MKVFAMTITMVFMLTACSGLSNDFACDKTANGSCISVSEANQKAKKGTINQEKSVRVNSEMNSSASQLNNPKESLSYRQPKRTSEKIHRIWIAPYIDADDHFHKEQVIYFSSTPSQWSGAQ